MLCLCTWLCNANAGKQILALIQTQIYDIFMQDVHKSIFPAPTGFSVRISASSALEVHSLALLYQQTWRPVGRIRVHLFMGFSEIFSFSFSPFN